MNARLVTAALVVAGAALIASDAQAQRRGVSSGRGVPLGHGGGGRIRVMARGGRRFFVGPGYFPYFYSDYAEGPGEAPPDQIVEQIAAPAPPTPPHVAADAMMIELQGDHWVRVTNDGETQSGGDFNPNGPQHTATAQPFAAPSVRRAVASESSAIVPSAVLVFRDGHQEEISKYMIRGATIYAGADYWNGGSWTRKVQIAELDVPATLKLNQGRGANFNLPSSPDEVMIRP